MGKERLVLFHPGRELNMQIMLSNIFSKINDTKNEYKKKEINWLLWKQKHTKIRSLCDLLALSTIIAALCKRNIELFIAVYVYS